MVNGLWTGQPTVTNKPTTYTNKYLNYLALESQNSNATFTIKGSNFGTKSGTVSLLSNVGTPIIGVTVTITSWSNTSITFSAKSLYTFTNSAGGAVAVSTQPNATTFSGTGAAKLSVLGFVGTISTRGYGQCVWYVADQRLAASILIPPSAYSTTATIGATYVPQIHDALVYGTKHVAIITSEPIKTVNGTTTTWTFTVANNFQAGQLVIISGCTPTGYNGTWTIATASSTQFTVTNSSNPGTGTVFGTATTVAQGFKNAMRVQRNSGTTSTAGFAFTQSLETQNSLPLAGKTVTLSFWARASSSISSNSLSAYITYGQGTDQNTIYGFTNQANFNQTFTTTSGWALYTLSNYTLPTNITQVGLYFFYTPAGTAGSADYFDITGVQLEIGSTATAFSRAGGTIQGELAACQRYYYSINSNTAGAGSYSTFGQGSVSYGATGYANVVVPYAVTMRVSPTLIYSGSFQVGNLGIPGFAVSSLALSQVNAYQMAIQCNATGLPGAGYGLQLMCNANNTSYVAFNSEL